MDAVSLPDAAGPLPGQLMLLECMAVFYEEVAHVKQAWARGSLAQELATPGTAPPTGAAELARAVSARLADRIALQHRALQRHATEAQLRAWQQAAYVMVALADEVFIFELDWAAQPTWLDVLLEQHLYRSRLAGRRFYEQAQRLLAGPGHDPLQADLAACFLLALQLGFKGMHRGGSGSGALAALRERLWHFIGGGRPARFDGPLFPQACEHTVESRRDERIAPLRPWLRAFSWWLGGYLLLSSLLWLWLSSPLLRVGGA